MKILPLINTETIAFVVAFILLVAAKYGKLSKRIDALKHVITKYVLPRLGKFYPQNHQHKTLSDLSFVAELQGLSRTGRLFNKLNDNEIQLLIELIEKKREIESRQGLDLI